MCAPPGAPSATHASELEIEFGAGVDTLDTPAPVDDDKPDVLLMALLTVGAAGSAAVLAMIGYVIRDRVGFWPHRPTPRDGSPSGVSLKEESAVLSERRIDKD